MKKQLKDYLPPILLKTYEFPLLWLIEQQEIDLLSDSISEVFDSQYILTAPLRGIERYEKIFKIIPYDTDTLEDRRFRIYCENVKTTTCIIVWRKWIYFKNKS